MSSASEDGSRTMGWLSTPKVAKEIKFVDDDESSFFCSSLTSGRVRSKETGADVEETVAPQRNGIRVGWGGGVEKDGSGMN